MQDPLATRQTSKTLMDMENGHERAKLANSYKQTDFQNHSIVKFRAIVLLVSKSSES